MADHGEIQYATADGNDVAAHEGSYRAFVEATFIGTALVVTIVIGLAIGGVLGHWLPAAFVIIAGIVAAASAAWTGSRIVSIGMVGIAALMLLFNAYA
jgi:hypothetical protein